MTEPVFTLGFILMDEIKTKLINDPSLVITSLSSRLKMMETSTEACSEP